MRLVDAYTNLRATLLPSMYYTPNQLSSYFNISNAIIMHARVYWRGSESCALFVDLGRVSDGGYKSLRVCAQMRAFVCYGGTYISGASLAYVRALSARNSGN
jgi:hypothetical protein